MKQKQTVENLRNTAKAVLRGKATVIQALLKEQEKSHVNNWILTLKELEKEEKNKAQSQQKEKYRSKLKYMKQRLKLQENVSEIDKAGSLKR